MFLKDSHKQFANGFAFRFWLRHALQLFKKARASIYMNQLYPHHAMKCLDDLLALVLAHEADVYIYTSQLLAHRLVHKRCSNGRVHPTRQATDHAIGSYLLANCSNLILDN